MAFHCYEGDYKAPGALNQVIKKMIRWSDHQTIRWSVFFIIIVGVFFLTEMFVFFALILQLHLDKPARLSFSCSLNLPLKILSNKCIKRLETALGCLTSPHYFRSDILSPSSLASLLLKKTSSSFDQLPLGVWDRHIFHRVFAEPEFQGPGWQNIWYGLAF